MPIYEFSCAGCGLRFERILPMTAAADGDAAPRCPACSSTTRRVPSRPALHLSASGSAPAEAGRPAERMPQTWLGTYRGNREYVTELRREAERRQEFEARHPELATEKRPVLAHEGRFERAPLRAGDPPPTPP